MGKLHTLRRAVGRKPEEYIYKLKRVDESYIGFVRGAKYHRGNFYPSSPGTHSYRKFVGKVLNELGYTVFYW